MYNATCSNITTQLDGITFKQTVSYLYTTESMLL